MMHFDDRHCKDLIQLGWQRVVIRFGAVAVVQQALGSTITCDSPSLVWRQHLRVGLPRTA